MGAERLVTSAMMREAEARIIAAGTAGLELMTRAGAEAARFAAGVTPPGGRVLVLCGPGNNGGDGFVVARRLAEAGFRVDVACSAPKADLTGDAARAVAEWPGPVRRLEEADPSTADLVVDALFGIGLGRDLDGVAADMVGRLTDSGCAVLSLDVPSGIDADTGIVRGAAVQARWTATFACRKPGLLLGAGRRHAGEVVVADIGISDAVLADTGPDLFVNGPDLWGAHLPRPRADDHKYDRGHVISVSGGPWRTGAARLAARGALRAGAGLVTVVTSARALSINAAHLTAIMLRVCDEPDEFTDLLTDERFNALVLGPALGVGEGTRRWVEAALEADRATVLDADALTSFEGEPAALRALVAAGRDRPVVLTPHEGEFKRMFGPWEDETEGLPFAQEPSKLRRARGAACHMGSVVVLKGPDTVIAAPDGRAAINANGSPFLATAGTGDVLGGMIAGLLAQGMPGYEAACAAVWTHADAARRFGPGLIAEDLPEVLPAVWRDLATIMP